MDGKQDDLQEIRCECGFLIGFQERKETTDQIISGTCIYCVSEQQFFRNEFSGPTRTNSYIYETIETDKSSWRRGLMHSRKQSIRWAFEDTEK